MQDPLLVIITLSLWLFRMCFYVSSTRVLELRIQCLIFVSKLACLFMVFGVLLQYNIIIIYMLPLTATRSITRNVV
jgi:hypothetical protein